MTHPLIGKRILWCDSPDENGTRTRTGHVKDMSITGERVLVEWERVVLQVFAAPEHQRWCPTEKLHIIHTTPLTEWLKEQACDSKT